MRVMAGLGHGAGLEGGSKEGKEKRNGRTKKAQERDRVCVQVRGGLRRQERPFLRPNEHTSFKALLP